MARCIKSTADNSSAVAPQKILTFRDTEMLFYAFSWRCFQKKKFWKRSKCEEFYGFTRTFVVCENGLKESCLFRSLFVAVKLG